VTGRTISHYRVLDKLGEGGMGVVYSAEDTKLERKVALKFLAPNLLSEEEAKRRFLREAKAAAALHHPNICTVFEVDEADGQLFLGMALLDGEPLEDRIAQGPLPLNEAVEIARHVAEGLEAAHRSSVVHRDIKPANIMVDSAGHVTIMDFGLARLTEASRLTKVDETVGTAGYMSPEQLQGSETDHRTDIWALGCVLYEMVAGVRAFKGEYQQALAYEIVNEQPEPLTSVRAGVPMELEFIAGKCLEKDPEDRYSTAAELAKDLRSLGDKMKSGKSRVMAKAEPASAVGAPEGPPRKYWAWAAAIALAFFLLGFVLRPTSDERPARQTVKFTEAAPEGLYLHSMAMSPDSSALAVAFDGEGGRSLWIRTMDEHGFREVPGGNGAEYPFWSPDGRWIGFFANGQLKKAALGGAPPETLCPAPDGRGGAWNRDGIIVFSRGGGGRSLLRISEAGGEATPIDLGDSRVVRRFPRFLPDGRRFLFHGIEVGAGGDAGIFVASLDGDPEQIVSAVDSVADYVQGRDVDTDRIWFVREGSLVAQPVDPKTLETRGTATVIAESVPRSASASHYAFTTNGDGAAAYIEGEVERSVLAWYDRGGRQLELVKEIAGDVAQVKLRPGERSGVISQTGADGLWLYEFSSDLATPILAQPYDDWTAAAWSPDGESLAFAQRISGPSARGALRNIMVTTVDDTSPPEVLVGLVGDHAHGTHLVDWSSDGRFVLFLYAGANLDIAASPVDGEGEPFPVVATEQREGFARFSPDGQWIAFESGPFGQASIFVQDFPEGRKRRLVSSDGVMPIWSPDGRELLYWRGDGMLMALEVALGDEIRPGRPQELFRIEAGGVRRGRAAFDVSQDGERFLLAQPMGDYKQPITIVSDGRH